MKRWDEKEIKIFLENYQYKTNHELLELLPNRTVNAIDKKARTYKLKKNKEIFKRARNDNNYLKKLKTNNYKEFIKHQKKAGKKGGEKIAKLYPNGINRQVLINWIREDPIRFIKHQKKAGKKAGIKLSNWLKLNPESHSIAGKVAHIKHPDLAHRMGSITQKRHPNLASKNMRKVMRLYPNLHRENGLKVGNFLAKNRPEHFVKMGKLGGQKTIEILRKNKSYYWKGVAFDSNAERKVAQLLLNQPKEGINCHIKIGSKTFDFFPQNYDKLYENTLIEYHPYDFDGRSVEEYTKIRLNALHNSKYVNIPLIVLTNINQISESNDIEKRYLK